MARPCWCRGFLLPCIKNGISGMRMFQESLAVLSPAQMLLLGAGHSVRT